MVMCNVLSGKLVVTANGRTSGVITSDGRCSENATSNPLSVYSLFPMATYHGCGVWKNGRGETFQLYNVEGDDSHVTVMSNFGELNLTVLNNNTSTIKIDKLEDIMDDRAVFHVTDSGWKIVDVSAFQFNFPDMTGFNTYAFKDNLIRKCRITTENDKVKYDIFE